MFRSVSLAAVGLASSFAHAQVLMSAEFNADAQGWSAVTDLGAVPPVTWQSSGGNPGGYLSCVDHDSGFNYWKAPASWLPMLAFANGGRLAYDLRNQPSTPTIDTEPDVIIKSPARSIVINVGPGPTTSWTAFTALLTPCAGWRVNSLGGAVVSAAEFADTLANATELLIRSEHRSGAETDSLDNVVLYQDPGGGSAMSFFDTDTEGWAFVNDGKNLRWLSSGGNPGGCLAVDDVGDGRYWWYSAPTKFLGNHSDLYGMVVSYSLYTNREDADPDVEGGVMIVGNGLTITADIAPPTVNVWNTRRVRLLPGPWRMNTLNGPVATAEQIQSVLSCVTQLRIRGEWSAELDLGRLDNVLLGTCPTDFDGSGFVDTDDFTAFVLAFEAGGDDADFDGTGFVDTDDFTAFVLAFEAGC